MKGHYHSIKEKQYIGYHADNNTLDTTRITIENPDSGLFIMSFTDPKTLKSTMSDKIKANANAATMRAAVWDFYWNSIRSNIKVSLTMYAEGGNVTTNATLSKKNVYEIKIIKYISRVSLEKVFVAKISSKANIKVEYPTDLGLVSTPPIYGYFRIKCLDSDGAVSYSDRISWNHNTNSIR